MDASTVQRALRDVIGAVDPAEFAKDSGVAKATIYRILKVGAPKPYAPRIDTIIAILKERGLSLSEFFARVEGLPAQPFRDRSSTPEVASHGADTALSSATHVPESLFIAGLQNLALTIDRAVDRLIAARTPARRARKQTATPRARTAVRDGRHRKVG